MRSIGVNPFAGGWALPPDPGEVSDQGLEGPFDLWPFNLAASSNRIFYFVPRLGNNCAVFGPLELHLSEPIDRRLGGDDKGVIDCAKLEANRRDRTCLLP